MDLEKDLEAMMDPIEDLVLVEHSEVVPPRRASSQRHLPLRTSALTEEARQVASAIGRDALGGPIMVVPERDPPALAQMVQTWSAGVDDPAEAAICVERQILEVASVLGREMQALGETPCATGSRELTIHPAKTARGGFLASIRVLLSAVRERPGVLVVMRPLRHLWLLRFLRRVRLVVCADEEAVRVWTKPGVIADLVSGLNRMTLRSAQGVIAKDSRAADKLRRAGLNGEDIQKTRPQFAARWEGFARLKGEPAGLGRICVVLRSNDPSEALSLRTTLVELSVAFPSLQIDILLESNGIDPVEGENFGQVKRHRCPNQDAEIALLSKMDLAVIWPGGGSEDCQVSQAIVAGTPVLAESGETVPDWVGPAVKRMDLRGAGAMRRVIARLLDNPAHLRRMRRSTEKAALGFFDREASLASRILEIALR